MISQFAFKQNQILSQEILILLSKINKIEVMFSIGTLDDSERKILEPNSSPIQNRLNSMKQISDLGIKTSVFFGPIYPTIKKENLSEIINTFIEYGAKEIMVDKFNLKPGILQVLKEKIPEKIDIVENVSYFRELYKEIDHICANKNVKAVLSILIKFLILYFQQLLLYHQLSQCCFLFLQKPDQVVP